MTGASAATLSPSVGAGGTLGQLQDKNANHYFRRFFSIPSKTNAAAPRRVKKNIKYN